MEPERVAREHGLERDGYFLYSGNLDGYRSSVYSPLRRR